MPYFLSILRRYMTQWVPELLAPAGSLEKLKVAVLYGANAVYLAGQKFGLRTAADNFTYPELEEGVEFAHQRGAKVYVVLNSFLHDEDLKELPEFLKYIEELKVDALIVSDLGVISCVQEHTKLAVHLSTQASCLNVEAAKLWKRVGVERVVLGREVSLAEARSIKEATGLEIEMFIHGSMCMAYSGHCVISNYTQGRDSNRGGCAHSCRFEYKLDFQNNKTFNSFFMSSKDLEGLQVLQEFILSGIDSLKVEGRMKSHHYVGTISKVYSDALKYYQAHGLPKTTDEKEKLQTLEQQWLHQLTQVSHRDYTTGSLMQKPKSDSIYHDREHAPQDAVVAAVVLEARDKEHLLVEVRTAFMPGERLELIPFSGPSQFIDIELITDVQGASYAKSRPGQLVKIPWVEEADQWNLLRKQVSL
jgi:putative protease